MDNDNSNDMKISTHNKLVYIDRFIEKYANISDIDTSLDEGEYHQQLKNKFEILCGVEIRIAARRTELIQALNDSYNRMHQNLDQNERQR